MVEAFSKLGSVPKIEANKLAISLVDLTSLEDPKFGDFRGSELFYPASIVKLFFLAATHIKLEDGSISDTPGLQQALKYMIVDSSNDAAGYVVDLLTGTTSGAQLSDVEMIEWSAKRKALNDIFVPLDYLGINICQKTWGDEPYGRDKIFLGADSCNRNRLTANDTARLLASIVQGQVSSSKRCRRMMNLLKRDYAIINEDLNNQPTGFCGKALLSIPGTTPEAKLWSKAGWTSKVRHDAAYIELASGKRLVMVIFTEGYSEIHELIPALAGEVLGTFI